MYPLSKDPKMILIEKVSKGSFWGAEIGNREGFTNVIIAFPEKYEYLMDFDKFDENIVVPDLYDLNNSKEMILLINERRKIYREYKSMLNPENSRFFNKEQANFLSLRLDHIQNEVINLRNRYKLEIYKEILKKISNDIILIKNSLIFIIGAFSYRLLEIYADTVINVEKTFDDNIPNILPYAKRILLYTTTEYSYESSIQLLINGCGEPYTGIAIFLDFLKKESSVTYEFINQYMRDTIYESVNTFSEQINTLRLKLKDVPLPADDEKSLPKVVYPDNFYRAKDKVSNSVYANKFSLGKFKPVVTSNIGKNSFGAIVKLDNVAEIELNNDGEGGRTVAFIPPLDENARIIFDAVATLYACGNTNITPKDIHKVRRNNPNAKMTVENEREIIATVDMLSSRKIIILSNDNTISALWREVPFKPEKTIYKKLGDKIEGLLLEARKYSTPYLDSDGEFREKDVCWKILRMPVLYEYAQKKGQIASTPMKTLEPNKEKSDFNIRRGGNIDVLRTFLATEIDTMEKTRHSKNPYSTKITCDRLYKINGVDEMRTEAAKKDKRSKTRKQVENILNLLLQNGADNFTGFQWQKKLIGRAQTYYSLEIILPVSSRKKQ